MTQKTNTGRASQLAVILVAATCLLLLLLGLRMVTEDPVPLVVVLAFALLVLAFRVPLADAANGIWLRRGLLGPSKYVRLEGPQDVEGHVIHIGLRKTTLRTPSGDSIRIPNTVLANSILTTFDAPTTPNDSPLPHPQTPGERRE